MKTQTLQQRLFRTTLLAMAFVLITPAVNAQRRSGGETTEKKQYEKSSNRESNREAAPRRDVQNNQSSPKRDAYQVKKEDVTRGNDHKKSSPQKQQHKKYNNQGNYHWNGQHKPNNGIHVHVSQPIIHQRDVHYYHHHPISFRKVPRKAIFVNLDGETYLLNNGKFYQANYWGYYRVKPPRYVHHLPEGCQIVYINGQNVFNLHGVLMIDTPLGFKIINS